MTATPTSRRLLPLEDRDTDSFAAARRWLMIYESRRALLAGRALRDGEAAEAAALEKGLGFWRRKVVELSGLGLDDGGLLLAGGGREVMLTPREGQLLRFLAEHQGEHFPDHALVERAWGKQLTRDQVRVYVHRLRPKLEGTGFQILNRRGRGYTLAAAAAPPTSRRDPAERLHQGHVEDVIGRSRSLLATQQLRLERAAATAARLRNALSRDGQGPAAGG